MKHRLPIAVIIAGLLTVGGVAAYEHGSTRGPSHGDTRPPAGALNPAVTQSTIATTICVKGWTATIRPPTSYTNKLKSDQMRARGLSGKASDYEEDHYIPLELGGNPTDPANLWPEVWSQARAKDREENALHGEVCGGRMRLEDAQRKMRDQTLWR